MQLIYISGPYTAANGRTVEANIAGAIAVGYKVRDLGLAPLVPHISVLPPRPWDGDPWKAAMAECLAQLRRCDALLMMPNWQDSRGARMEVRFAKAWGIPSMNLETLSAWVEITKAVTA